MGAIMPMFVGILLMKVLSSLKSAKKRDKNCIIVRRRKKKQILVLCPSNPRFKAKQG
jgi:ribosomal protein L36